MNWEHFFLLGWYRDNGVPVYTLISTESGRVGAVVTGYSAGAFYDLGSESVALTPLWDSPIPRGCVLHPIPKDPKTKKDVMTLTEKLSYAKKLGGVYVFGWWMDKPI